MQSWLAYYHELDYTSQTMVTLPNIFVPRVSIQLPRPIKTYFTAPYWAHWDPHTIFPRSNFYTAVTVETDRNSPKYHHEKKNIITPPEQHAVTNA